MKEIIQKKNDELRALLPSLPRPHRMVMTEGVRSLCAIGKRDVLRKIKEAKDFTEDNDPYGEHDTIFVELDDQNYICKIDYYDSNFKWHEENGNRVFTIMHASEY